MRVLVDLSKCQSYGQCVFAAPTVFRFHGGESLEFQYAPDESMREQVERAAAACPVQAITVGHAETPATPNATSATHAVEKTPEARSEHHGE